MNETGYDLRQARRGFSRIGWALCAFLLVTTVLQVIWVVLSDTILREDHWLNTSSWGMWLGTFIPQYIFGVPVVLLLMRGIPASKPEEHKLSTKRFFAFLAIGYCVMYAGNLIGTLLSMILSGGNAENAILEYAQDTNPLKLLFMVIMAPLMEELICRKLIIDRARQYGEKTAVFLSAIVFGLLHQNFFQFFYAFGMGLIFGYIYIRTGCLRYPILLHAIYNFMGAVIAPWILKLANLDAFANLNTADPMAFMRELGSILPGLMVYLLYPQILMGLVVFGIVMLIIRWKKATWQEAENPLPQGKVFQTVYLNAGMILYALLCIASIILALF